MKKVIALLVMLAPMAASAADRDTWDIEAEESVAIGRTSCNGYGADYNSMSQRVKAYWNINDRWSIGGGFGAQLTFSSDNDDSDRFIGLKSLPLFAHARVRPLHNLNWFAGADTGYNFPIDSSGEGGAFLRLAIGFQKMFYTHFGISVTGGYEITRYNNAPNRNGCNYGPEECNSFNANSFMMSFSLVF